MSVMNSSQLALVENFLDLASKRQALLVSSFLRLRSLCF